MLSELAADLAAGRTTARNLVEDCLARIADPAGEGGRAFMAVDAEGARAAADYHDRLRQAGRAVSPWAGIPISIKDLFDIAGEVTRAGSVILNDAAPATADAVAVARVRAAGFVPIGRTTMTEFAYSGLGLNPHYGTPKNPFDRATGRIPGGSTSGGAVSVTDGMAAAAIGTDTGGSCRIPAALCGIVGFKPTARRVPLDGAYPLSFSLDSIGPLAASVTCCAILDGVLAGESGGADSLAEVPLAGLRIAVPRTLVFDDVDGDVASAFEAALGWLAEAGARIVEVAFAELNEIVAANAKGGFPAAESYAVHRRHIETVPQGFDPRVLVRVKRGAEQDAADYIHLRQARAELIRRASRVTADFDVVAMPTVPWIAPSLAALEDDAAYGRVNILMLRNPTVANFLDRCAISLPCQRAGEAPVGLMLMGETGADRRLLATARTIERALEPRRR